MADKEVKFTFRLPEALYRRLLQQAAADGTTVSDVVRTIVVENTRIESVLSKLDEFDISRRFRELYAQARLSNHGLDALARAMLGEKYDSWRMAVSQNLEQEKAKRKEVTAR